MLLFCLVLLAWEEPLRLNVDNLAATAARVYREGAGREETLAARHLTEAQDRIGGPLTQIDLGLTHEEALGDTTVPGEDTFDVALALSPPGLRAQRRRVLQAEVRTAEARNAAGERTHVSAIFHLFAAAEKVHNDLAHLQSFLVSGREIAARLAASAEEGLISQDDHLAWQAHLAVLLREEEALEGLADAAKTALSQSLGRAVHLDFGEHLHLEESFQHMDNPWTDLVALAVDDPEIRVWSASAEVAEAAASSILAENRVRVAPTLNLRDADGDRWLGLGFRTSFSLQPRRNTAWQRTRLEEDRARVRREWQQRQTTAGLRARAEAFERRLARIDVYRDQILGPLSDRVTLLERGLAEGHVDVRRLVDAREQLHEGEHQYLGIILFLEQEHREATMYRTYLESNP